MKKSLLVLLALVATSAFASDNWQSGDGNLQWRNGDGTLCWRDNSWTPATAAKGCDGWISPAGIKPVSATKVTLQADALFDFDKSVVKPEGRAMLDAVVAKLKGIKIEVAIATGNTDSIGTEEYNKKLGQRRADAVKAYLTSKGITNVYTESRGERDPVATNSTAQGRAKNRRVELEIIGTK